MIHRGRLSFRLQFVSSCVIVLLAAVCAASAATPARRLGIADVNLDAVVSETQPAPNTEITRFELVWYIPANFWEISMAKDKSIPPAAIEEVRQTMTKYFLVAMVQGEVTAFGATRFTPADSLAKHARVSFADAAGKTRLLQPVPEKELEDDVNLLLKQLRPIVVSMLGSMGENLQFLVFRTTGDDKQPVGDAYRRGALVVDTLDRNGENPASYRVDFPLNSFFEPRKCPNGEPAHISWKFCPWTGQKLEELTFDN